MKPIRLDWSHFVALSVFLLFVLPAILLLVSYHEVQMFIDYPGGVPPTPPSRDYDHVVLGAPRMQALFGFTAEWGYFDKRSGERYYVITSVTPNGYLARSGFEVGDVPWRRGYYPTGFFEFYEALQKACDGNPSVVTVMRASEMERGNYTKRRISIAPIIGAGAQSPGDWISQLLESQWIADEMHALEEPLIGSLHSEHAFYRFVWLRAFDRSVAVTITKRASGAILTVKALDKPLTVLPTGALPRNLTLNREVELTEDQWYQLNSLSFRGFWACASRDDPNSLDGSTWILEGSNGEDDHRVIVQCNPGDTPSNPFRLFCLRILELSTLDLTRERMY